PAGCEVARVAAERGHKVTLTEASDRLGGQFRLAGLQPRRAQITDYIDWFRRQLEKLGVDIQYNTYMDADDVRNFVADVVVLATGSLPSERGWQRGLPTRDRLPGVDGANVCSVQDVMSRSVRLGKRVLLLDDVGTWKGGGTAWYLAEREHDVTIVTADTVVGREIVRTAADLKLRETLKRLGAKFVTESAVQEWHGDAATIVDLLDGSQQRLEFDNLVLATVNESMNELEVELRGSGLETHAIGDCVSPRQTPAATYEGRRLGLNL
ncbi:MAG: NAD(P)/FAD-dependent oxidoreductase, partial [Gammaproteobacteria bacterium]|nr:NAD(P)/FAD-dependent oxidoreductase [Gammaproteobacteria bacterium]